MAVPVVVLFLSETNKRSSETGEYAGAIAHDGLCVVSFAWLPPLAVIVQISHVEADGVCAEFDA
jgi:hypothetical protein